MASMKDGGKTPSPFKEKIDELTARNIPLFEAIKIAEACSPPPARRTLFEEVDNTAPRSKGAIRYLP